MNEIHLVAVNVRSALNVGAFFRTADAMGVSKIWLAGYTPTPEHESVRKTALGAENVIAWESIPDVIGCFDRLRADGLSIIGLECGRPGSVPLQDCAPVFPCAIVVGNEVEGLSGVQCACCDAIVEIPQLGSKESLNVSVAAGIALWHLRTRMSFFASPV